MSKKVAIDFEECIGCGSCHDLCPEVFGHNEEIEKAEEIMEDDGKKIVVGDDKHNKLLYAYLRLTEMVIKYSSDLVKSVEKMEMPESEIDRIKKALEDGVAATEVQSIALKRRTAFYGGKVPKTISADGGDTGTDTK